MRRTTRPRRRGAHRKRPNVSFALHLEDLTIPRNEGRGLLLAVACGPPAQPASQPAPPLGPGAAPPPRRPAALLTSAVLSLTFGAGVRACYWRRMSDSLVAWSIWFAVVVVPALPCLCALQSHSTPPIASTSARSVFAYLLIQRDRSHTRDLLASTLWPDLPDDVARRRLSQALPPY
jgi:hypothetical protein